MIIRLGTRKSALALAQSGMVARSLGPDVALVGIVTEGDRLVDVPLRGALGKGFFTAALESALLAGEIDFAVHSLKDVPVADVPGTVLGAIPERAAVEDVLLVRAASWNEGGRLPVRAGATIGASSPRRQSLIHFWRPDVQPQFLRGNITTRIERLARGDFDAIVLAEAGLVRLGAPLPADIHTVRLSRVWWPPAPGQGALALQCRADDHPILARLAAVHHAPTARAVLIERGWLQRLGGGCSIPFGAWTDGDAWALSMQSATGCVLRRGVGIASGTAAVDTMIDPTRSTDSDPATAGSIWTPCSFPSFESVPHVDS